LANFLRMFVVDVAQSEKLFRTKMGSSYLNLRASS
jgi:hypothetical protein